jgi:hypothetical protein
MDDAFRPVNPAVFAPDELDEEVVSAAIEATRQFAALPNLTEEQAHSLARALRALERLPVASPGVQIEYGISLRGGDGDFRETRSWQIAIMGDQLSLYAGGCVGDAAVGSDSYTIFQSSAGVGCCPFADGDLYEWDCGVRDALGLDPEFWIDDESGSDEG